MQGNRADQPYPNLLPCLPLTIEALNHREPTERADVLLVDSSEKVLRSRIEQNISFLTQRAGVFERSG
jgi:hypothetical protein